VQGIDRPKIITDLEHFAFIQKRRQALTRADRHVMVAFRAYMQVFIKLGGIQRSAAIVAFFPQSFGNTPFDRALGPDSGRHQFA
jgi:hypothetical protein